jgi:hypothetical protein
VNRVKKGGKRLSVVADESQVMRVEIPEWRIVDDITWRRAQELIAERAESAPAVNSESRSVHALSGISKCGVCGGGIGVTGTRSVGRVTVRAYGCIRHATRGSSICPVTIRKPVEVVEGALVEALRVAVERPDVVGGGARRGRVTGRLGGEHGHLRARGRASRAPKAGPQPEPRGRPARRRRPRRATRRHGPRTAGGEGVATATQSPVEAAGYIAQAQETVRAQLGELREALASDPKLAQDFLPAGARGAHVQARRASVGDRGRD